MWARGGSAPEIQQPALEQSIDGTNYLALGMGIRTNGSWQFTD